MPHRIHALAVAALAAGLALPALAAAEPALATWNGHLTFGYAKLFRADAPSGSLSLGAGVDHAVSGPWRAGAVLGYQLLGSTQSDRGSLTASVDYSVFDMALTASHDLTGRHGLLRLAAGPGLMSARAELSTAGGGALFEDLAVNRTAPELAVDATWMSGRPHPVRAGLETGMRWGFLPHDVWPMWTTRVAIHY